MLVVGEVDLDRLYAACRAVEAQLHLDVNPTVITKADWQHPPEQSFISQVKAGPLVAVPPTCPSGP